MKKKTIFFLLFVLPIVLSSYAQTEVDKNFIASNTFERAVKEFVFIAKDLYYNSSYVNKINYENYYGDHSLRLEFASGSTEIIVLNKLDAVMLYKDSIRSESIISAFSKNEIIHYWVVSNPLADKFFVLLGNLLEANKEEKIKGYKTAQTYDEKLKFLKKLKYNTTIKAGSVIKLINTNKQDKDYSKLKKRKGQEFNVVENLVLNADLKTYRGLISTAGENKYSVSNIELEYIKAPTLALEEQKKTQQEKETDSLFAVYNKEHFQTITALSKTTLEADNKGMSKNGFAFIDESIVMAYTDLTVKKAYGQSYKLDPKSTYVFVVTGLGLNKVSVLCGGKSLNIPALNDDPYEASVTKPLKIEDGVNQYILTISTARDYNQGLLIEVFGEFVQYAYIRRYKKK